jgi:hypothetical protein
MKEMPALQRRRCFDRSRHAFVVPQIAGISAPDFECRKRGAITGHDWRRRLVMG